MNFNLHNLDILGKIGINESFSESGVKEMSRNIQLDEFMKNIIFKIKEAKISLEADKFLYDLSNSSEPLESIEECYRYKYKDFNIVTCLDYVGESIVKKLKELNSLGLSIVPNLVGTISKDKKIYIITQNAGTQNGKLKPYFVDGTERVPTEAKLKAYKDLQKLTKAGLVDEQNLRAGNWFYTPENKIFLPNWNNLRQLRSDESPKDIIEQYYNIIFGK